MDEDRIKAADRRAYIRMELLSKLGEPPSDAQLVRSGDRASKLGGLPHTYSEK